MSDDPEAEFRSRARWLLAVDVPRATPEDYAAYLADPTRVATAPLATLLALDAANDLADDPAFALMRATIDALDRIDWEHELVRAHPPPMYFDAGADDAFSTKVVVHPAHGVGMLELLPADDPADGYWHARVIFRDGERTFRGADTRWEHPRRTFAFAASLLLAPLPDTDEEAFWPHVDAIAWASGRPIDDLAAELATRVGLVECVALHGRLHRLGSALRARIEAWEAAGNGPLPCGDDSFGDLVDHIVGLGRATYHATLEDPSLALRRAEARDYRESFAYVFLRAEHLYDLAEIVAALREHAQSALVEHPTFGLGVIHRDSLVFPGRILPA